MKILINGINYFPELTGIGKYTGEMAGWLAAHGHEVRVVTAPPYYPEWRVGEEYSAWGYRKEVIKEQIGSEASTPTLALEEQLAIRLSQQAGKSLVIPLHGGGDVVVYRCPLWVPARPSGLKRLVHLASFALFSFPVVLWQARWRPDVVLVVAPALFCAPGAWLAARLCRARAWLHIQDFEVDAAFELGLLKGGLLRRGVLGFERWLLRRFDRVSTISRRMLARLGDKGVPGERCVLFPNWVDLEGLRAGGSGLSGYREELGIPHHAVVALYSGNMGKKQGLEILAEAARQIQDTRLKGQASRGKEQLDSGNLNLESEIIFVFCGNGAGRADLVARCAGLSNVRFLDLQPAERLGELLGMADIHLLPQRADAADLVMPSKLTGMLASGKPVVATAHDGTEVAEVVNGRGVVVSPGDAAAFAAAIAALAADPARRRALGAAGREYAKAYLARDTVLGRFEEELRKTRTEG